MILVVGLILNAALNFPLISWWGLSGSVTATAIASGVILALVLRSISRQGEPLGWATWVICFTPALLLAGRLV